MRKKEKHEECQTRKNAPKQHHFRRGSAWIDGKCNTLSKPDFPWFCEDVDRAIWGAYAGGSSEVYL